MSADASTRVLGLLSCVLLRPVWSVQSQMCDMMKELEKERDLCEAQLENKTTGCSATWDKITCWPSADVGEVVTIPCPKYLFYFSRDAPARNLSKTCAEDGWSSISIDSYIMDCGYDPNSTTDDDTGEFFDAIKVGYTIGHSMSLISLTIAIIILCLFRKLHCTRNYIHMHLFVAFILKAVAVFIKDLVLYDVGETDNCQSSSVSVRLDRDAAHLIGVLQRGPSEAVPSDAGAAALDAPIDRAARIFVTLSLCPRVYLRFSSAPGCSCVCRVPSVISPAGCRESSCLRSIKPT